MRIMLLTGDRNTARQFLNAANESGAHRLCVVNHAAQALELLFRTSFDALLSDDPNILHPRIRRCPVLWPEAICLLMRSSIQNTRLPKELTFCFPIDSNPKDVLFRIGSLPTERGRQTDPNVLISSFLQRTGVPVSLIGFDCMCEAIRILISVDNMTKAGLIGDVYEILGQMMQIRPIVAEHAIRNAINAAWIRADAGTLERIFGYTVDAERAAPSNAAFLFRAADQIKLDLREGNENDAAGNARSGGRTSRRIYG
jgi:hypothetical protein